MRASSLGFVWLGLRVRDKVRVSVRDRVGVSVSDGVRISTFYFFVTLAARRSPHPRRPAFYPNPPGVLLLLLSRDINRPRAGRVYLFDVKMRRNHRRS